MLAELLKANEELTDALRVYDDLERLGVEKEVQRAAEERSRRETRLNRSVSGCFLEHAIFNLAFAGDCC